MPANNLETMRQRLRDSLFDVNDETWNAGEKDDILAMAARRLSKRLPRPLDPTAAAQTITLVDDTYFYAIDAGITNVEKVFYINTDSDRVGFMQSGWEVTGDIESGTAKLHVAPLTVSAGGTLQITGVGRYNIPAQAASQTAIIPDDYVPLVLAWSRAECYRRLVADRARFRQWQTSNQVQNVSVNELLQMIAAAETQANEEWAMIRRPSRPVIGRI